MLAIASTMPYHLPMAVVFDDRTETMAAYSFFQHIHSVAFGAPREVTREDARQYHRCVSPIEGAMLIACDDLWTISDMPFIDPAGRDGNPLNPWSL
jgi:hypothetical protein